MTTGEIDDAETPHSKTETVFGPETFIVRAAMYDRGVHFPHDVETLFSPERTCETDDSAH
jgi:hypothetical protein